MESIFLKTNKTKSNIICGTLRMLSKITDSSFIFVFFLVQGLRNARNYLLTCWTFSTVCIRSCVTFLHRCFTMENCKTEFSVTTDHWLRAFPGKIQIYLSYSTMSLYVSNFQIQKYLSILVKAVT